MGIQAVGSPEAMAEQATTSYYESLMSAKASEVNTRETLLTLFRGRSLSARMAEGMEARASRVLK